jgi:hypothetical protein
MPWTVKDVDRFKKGLSPSQKKQWVRIANSALKSCQSKGGKNCEASAIRQANGSVGNNENMETTELISKYSVKVNNYQIREETFEGRKYIVVPVVMMKEGVHSGSHGPILHREETLARYTEAWNGIPITVNHPSDEEGKNISANSPEVLEESAVGLVFNTHYSDGLRAEAWLDEEKLKEVDPDAYEYVIQGHPLDVSVGTFSDSEPIEGEWEGETYESIAINYRPDHLALLPGVQGACSWADGCGIRANQKGGSMEDSTKIFKQLNQDGYAVVPILYQEKGYRELLQSLQSQLDSMDINGQKYHHLQEVYEDYFIYAVHIRGGNGSETLYKRGYTVNDSGVVEFGDDPPVEVKRKVIYETMKKMVRTKKPSTNNQNEGGKMACCEDKVDRLIANKQTRFTADDKEFLMGLEESQLDKLSPMEPAKKEEDPAPQVNKEEVIDEFKGTLKSIEDYTALMPEEMKAQVDSGVKLYQEHRDSLIKGIEDNSGDNFSKEQLEAMDDTTLESIYKSVTPTDYSGQGATSLEVNKDGSGGILLPIDVVMANKEKED